MVNVLFCFCFEKVGRSGLSWACEEGHLEIVRLLVELGADINQTDKCGYTPCYYACWKGHLEVVWLLLDRGANPLIKDIVSFLSFLSLG